MIGDLALTARAFQRNWEDLLSNIYGADNEYKCRMDVKETSDGYVVLADLPGVEKKDIDISLKNGILSITCERATETQNETSSFHIKERLFGRFTRQMRVPTVDENSISASLTNGVLKIEMKKLEEHRLKHIKVDVK